MHALERFLPLVVDGDTNASTDDLAPDAFVFDPLQGPVPPPIVYWFLMARHIWMRERQARVEPVRTVRAHGRAVVEQILRLTVAGKEIDLPVALVADEAEDGKLAQVRIYHSLYPLTGKHEVRPPIIYPDETLQLAAPVSTYMAALASADVEGALACFAEDATVREPSGSAFLHSGPEGRRAWYRAILADGGIGLDHCTVIDDGAACAVEYVCVKWGSRMLPAQAGVAVYERRTPTTLGAARIYDDVDPPAG